MEGTALVMWIVTIGGGALLAGLWVLHGGAKRPADADPAPGSGRQQTLTATRTARSRIGISMITNHAGLAVLGAVTWILYTLNSDDEAYRPLRWLALALLVVTIGLGLSMFNRWLADRRRAEDGAEAQPPEQHLPAVVVLLHGIAAAATLVLVLLAAFSAA